MIKKHKGFILINLCTSLVFVLLMIYYFLKNNEVDDLYKKTEKQIEDLVEIKTKLFLENSLETDLTLATTGQQVHGCA